MNPLTDIFLSPLRESYFQKALTGGSMVALVCGVVGCLVILRRMSFLGDALSHAMIAGVAGGYLFMKMLFGIEAYAPAMLIGSLIAAVLTVALIAFVSRMSRIKEDTAIGIMYTGVFAGGVVLVSVFRNYIHIDLMHFIMGDVLGITDTDLWTSGITSALVLSVIILFFRHFQISSFDPVMAASIGMPVLLIDYTLTTCVSLVVVSAVSMVGVILVVGLLITPAATAYLLSDRLDRMMGLAAFFGVSSVVGGLYLCVWLDSAGGGAIMLFSTLQFLIVLIAAPRYGLMARWLQLHRMVPQQLTEDILGLLARREKAAEEEIRRDLSKHKKVGTAIRNLIQKGFLRRSEGDISLTESGQKEASRILRAHRLWETYLRHVGTPAGEIHDRAHELEHMNDEAAIRYIDDLLGHPVNDPRGKTIPPDQKAAVPGQIIPLSYLRSGNRGIIEKAGISGLGNGEEIYMESRGQTGEIWNIVKNDGSRLKLSHEEADRIMVKYI
ncbi:MAG: iron chelate uptake ABC transporter family permease subunit [Desulfococcaceae bacterium]|jgi:manganese/iron transport system permease protein/iron/zinc/copper transport system permease protein|nr:iron chelate uptake ABC transporter family permease subunit [Desulfococcaceae bacterium]